MALSASESQLRRRAGQRLPHPAARACPRAAAACRDGAHRGGAGLTGKVFYFSLAVLLCVQCVCECVVGERWREGTVMPGGWRGGHDDEARDSAVCLFAGEGVRVARTEVHGWNTKYTNNVCK